MRHRIDKDNIYFIGLNCGGTVSPVSGREMIDLFYEANPDDVVSEEIDKGKFIIKLANGSEEAVKIHDLEKEGYGRRGNCQRCDVKIPRKANIACGNWGAEDGWTFIEINDEKGVGGTRRPVWFHRRLGEILYAGCGVSRSEEGLKRALEEVRALREEFWADVKVVGGRERLNQELEKALRVADFLELAEVMIFDALDRRESAGAHFREEYPVMVFFM